ncbi:hypothetical protein A7X67_08255 [Clostridium sp. W14A]|nr:hypothetical protein A7X67_08255 [Clostridium sp. W14A]
MGKNKITDGLRQKSNGVWERAEIINGKRRWFSSLDPEEVWKKRNAALGEAKNEQVEKDKGPLFEAVSTAYRKKLDGMKYGTQRAYLPMVVRAESWFSGKHMQDIEPYMVSEFLQSVSGMAKTTVSNQKTVLNAIFQMWIESPVWRGDKNPSKIVSIPRGLKHTKREPPTEDQVKIVKEHYLDSDALPAVVFLCTGERRGEACGIQMKDIDFANSIIHITKAIKHIHNQPRISGTKTKAGVRSIPLLSMLQDALTPLRSMPPETYILSGTTQPLTASQYTRRWAAFWRKYGMAHPVVRVKKRTRNGKEYKIKQTDWVADVCAHQFRHEYVCMLCEAGVSEEVAILLVGHANVQMIHEVYLSLKPKMITDAGTKLNNLLNPVHT